MTQSVFGWVFSVFGWITHRPFRVTLRTIPSLTFFKRIRMFDLSLSRVPADECIQTVTLCSCMSKVNNERENFSFHSQSSTSTLHKKPWLSASYSFSSHSHFLRTSIIYFWGSGGVVSLPVTQLRIFIVALPWMIFGSSATWQSTCRSCWQNPQTPPHVTLEVFLKEGWQQRK